MMREILKDFLELFKYNTLSSNPLNKILVKFGLHIHEYELKELKKIGRLPNPRIFCIYKCKICGNEVVVRYRKSYLLSKVSGLEAVGEVKYG